MSTDITCGRVGAVTPRRLCGGGCEIAGLGLGAAVGSLGAGWLEGLGFSRIAMRSAAGGLDSLRDLWCDLVSFLSAICRLFCKTIDWSAKSGTRVCGVLAAVGNDGGFAGLRS